MSRPEQYFIAEAAPEVQRYIEELEKRAAGLSPARGEVVIKGLGIAIQELDRLADDFSSRCMSGAEFVARCAAKELRARQRNALSKLKQRSGEEE